MSQEDMFRNSSPRQPMGSKYPAKKGNYSPSTSFNYNRSSGPGYGNVNGNTYNGNTNFNSNAQHPRRRTDRFKREAINYSERLVRQNDTIIKLLKEIRNLLADQSGQSVAPDSAADAAYEGREPDGDRMELDPVDGDGASDDGFDSADQEDQQP